MKLTPQQNMVINCLQNGWIFISSSESSSITVGNSAHQFEIGSRLFWNLSDKGLIFQNNKDHEWGLTDEGKVIKTKNIQEDIVKSLEK